ncbi:unnamed protein product [Trichobilharzia regenti]|nr:unnamed protein product [Trichobilharzia regenti]
MNIVIFLSSVNTQFENEGGWDVSANKSLRPAVLSTFGDLSLALGSEFWKYLPVVLETLSQATQAEVNLEDPDMVEYLNSLRTSCLEAYTGVIQGLKGDGPRECVFCDVNSF